MTRVRDDPHFRFSSVEGVKVFVIDVHSVLHAASVPVPAKEEHTHEAVEDHPVGDGVRGVDWVDAGGGGNIC